MAEAKMCPACGQIMNYNLEGLKKNSKAPHFKCSDPSCKRQFNKQTNEWEDSQYITSVWDDKIASQYGTPPVAENKPNWPKIRKENDENIKWNMCLKIAAEAWINGMIPKEDIVKTTMWFYKQEPNGD